jgi:hypothetical protein
MALPRRTLVGGPAPESGEGRWRHLDVHDSDIAILSYAPASTGAGVAYLGFTPRVLFEDESASAPTDPDREAAALGAWFAQECGGEPGELTALVRSCLADDADDESHDDLDDEDLPEEEVFVEVKAARLLRESGIGEPAAYWDDR